MDPFDWRTSITAGVLHCRWILACRFAGGKRYTEKNDMFVSNVFEYGAEWGKGRLVDEHWVRYSVHAMIKTAIIQTTNSQTTVIFSELLQTQA